MRQTFFSGSKGIMANNKGFVGMALSFAFCAEHEWGIEGIENAFGIYEQEDALASYTVAPFPETDAMLSLVEYSSSEAVLIGGELRYRAQSLMALPKENLMKFGGDESADGISAAWCSRNFCIIAHTQEAVACLKALYEALMAGDAMINPPLVNKQYKGLKIYIKSMLMDEDKKAIVETVYNRRRLAAALEATGIVDKLKQAKLGYYALSPDLKKFVESEQLLFWLNPHQQDKFNSGWFTLEDLQQWAEGKGPVIKQ